MDVKEYLREVRGLRRDIKTKQREREELWSLISSPGSMHPKEIQVQSSIPKDKQGDILATITDIDRIINDEISEYTTKINKAREIIGSLSKPIHRTICTEYYILGSTWEQVANGEGYSVSHVQKMHGWALHELYQRYSEKMI